MWKKLWRWVMGPVGCQNCKKAIATWRLMTRNAAGQEQVQTLCDKCCDHGMTIARTLRYSSYAATKL